MTWTGVTERKVTWNDIWRASSYSLKFWMSSVYDLLPTPVNLQLWGKREDAACGLCGRRASLEHILSSCKTALTQGRYRWRHDQVLKEIAQGLDEARKKGKTTSGTRFIQFVRPAGEATKAERQEHGLLTSAGDWEMLVDLERQLRFPQEIRSTALRPDIVIWSKRSKQVIIVELTVPWEDRVEEAYERKRAKYQDLQLECAEAGWKCWSFPVEVSARGFPAHSLWRMMSMLGLKGVQKRSLARRASEAAERGSCWLWLRSGDRQWGGSTGDT